MDWTALTATFIGAAIAMATSLTVLSQARHKLELHAPEAVLRPALTYFRTLRQFRDAVREGLVDGPPSYERAAEYADHVRQVKETIGACRDMMRADIAPGHRLPGGRRRELH